MYLYVSFQYIYFAETIYCLSLRLEGEENIFVSVGYRVEKFNIISNDHRRTQNCEFSVLDRKYPS